MEEKTLTLKSLKKETDTKFKATDKELERLKLEIDIIKKVLTK